MTMEALDKPAAAVRHGRAGVIGGGLADDQALAEIGVALATPGRVRPTKSEHPLAAIIAGPYGVGELVLQPRFVM
jgi:hypothetical protein